METDSDAARRALVFLAWFACCLACCLALSGCEQWPGWDEPKPLTVDTSRREEPGPRARENELTYAYLPQYSHAATFERHHLLVQRLSTALGRPVRQIFPSTFNEHVELFSQGKIDVSFSNPFVYAQLHAQNGAKALARVVETGEAGADTGVFAERGFFRGQVIVRADSPIRTLEDCRGKRWIAVDPSSAGGFLFPLGLFVENGIKREDFAEIAFAPGPGGKQEKVVLAVLSGEYDLGTIREGAEELLRGKAPIDALRVLARTRPYPGWTFAVRGGLDPRAVETIRRTLLELTPERPDDAAILRRAGLAGVVPASEADFAPVRDLAARIWEVPVPAGLSRNRMSEDGQTGSGE